MDAECDFGTEYCQVMKLVCDEAITWVPLIAIHIGSKCICLAVEIDITINSTLKLRFIHRYIMFV